MRVAVLVPRREDGAQRDLVWDWISREWLPDCIAATAGDVQVGEGHHPADEGEFNRALAINRAAEYATPWDVAVVVDADTIVGPHQFASAVAIAAATGMVTFGFGRFAHLTEKGTRKIMGGFRGNWEPHVEKWSELTASSCVAVTRDLWEHVGGFDTGFVGWGFEDVALSLACQTLGGGHHRVAGTAWHLWHEPSPHTGNADSPIWRANADRCQLYIDAAGDPAAMTALLDDLAAAEAMT